MLLTRVIQLKMLNLALACLCILPFWYLAKGLLISLWYTCILSRCVASKLSHLYNKYKSLCLSEHIYVETVDKMQILSFLEYNIPFSLAAFSFLKSY